MDARRSLLSADIATGTLAVGTTFTVDADASVAELAHLNALTEGMTFNKVTTDAAFREIDASQITRNIEAVQKKINTARVQAGSQYAALESAVIYTTDLTAQYELGYNTVHDVNFLHGDGTFGEEPNPSAGRDCHVGASQSGTARSSTIDPRVI